MTSLGRWSFGIALLLVGLATGLYLGSQVVSVDANQAKSLEQRVDDLEVRVTLLEATVEASNAEPSDGSPDLHTITGEYVERPELAVGENCINFYDPGTKVFISDFEGNVLGTGELGEGQVVDDGMCSQPFEVPDVPEADGYVINFERRSVGSAYEFTLEDLAANDWHVVVVSRYRQ